jgi:hypothetical protein
MKSVDYVLLDQLLADESLSFRECAERAGCSDWSARQRYRKLSGDDRPMKMPRAECYSSKRDNSETPPLTTTEKVIAGGIVALVLVGLVALGLYVRRDGFPPYDPAEGPMQ